MLIIAALSLVLLVLVIQRTIPILFAGVVAWTTWSATKSLSLMVTAGLATLFVSRWVLDAAVGHARTRTIVLTAEIGTAALVAGGMAMSMAAGSHALWIGLMTATAAAVIVAHWRQVAF